MRRGALVAMGVALPLAIVQASTADSPRPSHETISMRIAGPRQVLVGDRLAFALNIAPAVVGETILERQRKHGWSPVERSRVTRQMTVLSLRQTSAGKFEFRAVVRSSGHAPLITKPVVVSVRAQGVEDVPRSGTVIVPTGEPVSVSGDPDGNETTHLAAAVAPPPVGGVLVVPVSKDAPGGVLGRVQRVTTDPDGSHSVVSTPASLDEAYSNFHVVLSGTLGELEASAKSFGLVRRATRTLAGSPCSANGLSVSPSIDLSDLHVEFSLYTHPPEISFLLAGTPSVRLTLHSPGGFTCTLPDSASIPIPVPGTPLVVTVGPHVEVSASGEVDASLVWSPRIAVGFERVDGINQDYHTISGGATSISFGLAANAEAYLGGELGVTVADRAGVSGTFGPDVTANFTTPAGKPSPCVEVTAGLKAELTANANVWFKDFDFTLAQGTFDSSELYENCTSSSGSSGGGSSAGGTTGSGSTGGGSSSSNGSSGGASGAGATPESISIGWSGSHTGWISITLSGFATGSYTYACDFGNGGDANFSLTETSEPETFDNGQTCEDADAGDTVWVTINGISSNKITVPSGGGGGGKPGCTAPPQILSFGFKGFNVSVSNGQRSTVALFSGSFDAYGGSGSFLVAGEDGGGAGNVFADGTTILQFPGDGSGQFDGSQTFINGDSYTWTLTVTTACGTASAPDTIVWQQQ